MQQPYVDQREPHVRAGLRYHPIIPLVISYLNEEGYRKTVNKILLAMRWPNKASFESYFVKDDGHGTRSYQWSEKRSITSPFTLHQVDINDAENDAKIYIGGQLMYHTARYVAYLNREALLKISGVTFNRLLDAQGRKKHREWIDAGLRQLNMQKMMEQAIRAAQIRGAESPIVKIDENPSENPTDELVAETDGVAEAQVEGVGQADQ